MNKHPYAVTLLELIIAIAILGLLVIGLSSIDLFSHYHVISSDRRAKLQNDAIYILEHMAKNIAKAIGGINSPPISLTPIGGDNAITVWIDYNSNGQRDASDKQIAYRYIAANYQMWYYSNYTDSPASYEIIALNKIRPNFSSDTSQPTYRTYNSVNNYIAVQISACWDPDGLDPDGRECPCGSIDNPALTMRNRISMPGVSTN